MKTELVLQALHMSAVSWRLLVKQALYFENVMDVAHSASVDGVKVAPPIQAGLRIALVCFRSYLYIYI